MCSCNNAKYTEEVIDFKNRSYKVNKCLACGMVETMPVDLVREDIYETGHYTVKPYFIIPILINIADYFFTIVTLFKAKIGRASRILDFGCGKGYFLFVLQKFGFLKLAGIETSISRASFARKITNLEIGSDFYNSGTILGNKYDCIIMIHVLEHIQEPFNFTNVLINDGLNDNGIVYIEVPNIGSMASQIAGTTWAHFTPHFHTNHFTIASFRNYCINNKYSYKLAGTFSFYNSAMGMTSAILKLFGYKGIIFEDMKNKKIAIIFLFLVLMPLSLFSELIFSLFNRGSVIKFIVRKTR